ARPSGGHRWPWPCVAQLALPAPPFPPAPNQRTQAASEGALDVEGLCSAFRTKAAVRVPDPVGHVPTCGLATGVLKPVAKPGDAWMSPPSAPRGRGNRELRALALEAHSGSAAEVPSAAKPGRVAAQAAGSGGAELAGDATACSRGNVVPALASQAGPALPYDTCRLGSVQALSPVKAGRGATDQLGSQTVLTPVRRSARTSCSKPLTPVGTLLEATSYSYTPNTYLQR
ncbi:hypothetical protein TSOC_013979, partial [Tetrabaena socialis]